MHCVLVLLRPMHTLLGALPKAWAGDATLLPALLEPLCALRGFSPWGMRCGHSCHSSPLCLCSLRWLSSWWPSPMKAASTCLTQLRCTRPASECPASCSTSLGSLHLGLLLPMSVTHDWKRFGPGGAWETPFSLRGAEKPLYLEYY